MSRTERFRNGPASLLLSIALVALGLTGLSTSPTFAEHQNCTGDYPTGTLPIGHPDFGASQDIGWNGQVALNNAETRVFVATALKETLLGGASVAGAAAEIIHEKEVEALKATDPPVEPVVDAILSTAELVARVITIALTTAAVAALVTETLLMTQANQIEAQIAGEDACASVITGDMVDQLWVATVQRNLASDGPPLAMLLIPTDSEEPGGDSGEWPIQPQHEEDDFDWCPEIDLPEALPEPAGETDLDQPNGPDTGGDCSPLYYDGFLDIPYDGAPRTTVQAIVRDSIDHAKAHGLPVRQAEDYYAAAVTALNQGRYKEAFVRFRSAYQSATGQDG